MARNPPVFRRSVPRGDIDAPNHGPFLALIARLALIAVVACGAIALMSQHARPKTFSIPPEAERQLNDIAAQALKDLEELRRPTHSTECAFIMNGWGDSQEMRLSRCYVTI